MLVAAVYFKMFNEPELYIYIYIYIYITFVSSIRLGSFNDGRIQWRISWMNDAMTNTYFKGQVRYFTIKALF